MALRVPEHREDEGGTEGAARQAGRASPRCCQCGQAGHGGSRRPGEGVGSGRALAPTEGPAHAQPTAPRAANAADTARAEECQARHGRQARICAEGAPRTRAQGSVGLSGPRWLVQCVSLCRSLASWAVSSPVKWAHHPPRPAALLEAEWCESPLARSLKSLLTLDPLCDLEACYCCGGRGWG